MTTRPTAVLFDFANTLAQSAEFDARAGNSALLGLAKQPCSVSVDEVLAEVPILEEALREVIDSSEIEFTAQQFNRLLFDGLGVSFDARPDELELCLWKAAIEYSAIAGVVECLADLQARGIRMGVVSNYPFSGRTITWELNRLGILNRFEFVLSSADCGVRKPHDLIFKRAIARLGVEDSKIWFVGDTLETDIVGANAAGLFSVWYSPDGGESDEAKPGATIMNLTEIADLIEKVE